jgi:hypothetical protein
MLVEAAGENRDGPDVYRESPRKRDLTSLDEVCIGCSRRGTRWSILPILTLDGIVTHDIVHGSVTSQHFLRFLRELVVSQHVRHP